MRQGRHGVGAEDEGPIPGLVDGPRLGFDLGLDSRIGGLPRCRGFWPVRERVEGGEPFEEIRGNRGGVDGAVCPKASAPRDQVEHVEVAVGQEELRPGLRPLVPVLPEVLPAKLARDKDLLLPIHFHGVAEFDLGVVP